MHTALKERSPLSLAELFGSFQSALIAIHQEGFFAVIARPDFLFASPDSLDLLGKAADKFNERLGFPSQGYQILNMRASALRMIVTLPTILHAFFSHVHSLLSSLSCLRRPLRDMRLLNQRETAKFCQAMMDKKCILVASYVERERESGK